MADHVPKAEAMADTPQVPAASETALDAGLTQHPQPAAPPDMAMPNAPIEQAAVRLPNPLPSLASIRHASRRLYGAPLTRPEQSPALPQTGTPAQGSRAASAHPDAPVAMPSEAAPHGDPTRRYLNAKVTGVLLEGMKQLAKDQ